MKHVSLQTPIKVWYKSLPGSKVQWPIIDVNFNHRGISFPQPILALVDSGANISILHPLVTQALGFDFKKIGKPRKGGVSVSGEYESWILPELIDVNIYGYIFRLRFTVINNRNLIWPCILGEDSIFNIARLDFQRFKGYFEARFRTDIH